MARELVEKLRKCLKLLSIKKKQSFVLSVIFVAALVIGYTVLTKPANAEGALDINVLFRWLIEIMFWLSAVFMKFAIFFLELFINLARYNNYVNAPTVIIGWLLVRDVANMFFVVVLLVIAIGTILGIEQYEWKKTLVKFVMAAIFINFSKMICGLIIDLAHVFTITFLNAVQALAGGNLISMFKMSEVQSMLESTDPITKSDNFVYALFASAVLALIMSGVSMVAIGAYAIVMLARVVVLWVLIILSPLAFIMGVIPQAQAYSKQIWDKFGKQVMVAPVMVFFLWLSFATLGAGDAASQFGMDSASLAEAAAGVNTTAGVDVAKESDSLAVSISKAGTWENLASYMVAIAFMMVGISVVQGMGVVAGGLVQKAQDFAGSVAKIATGYALGRKIAGSAWDGAKTLGKKAAWNMPLIGGERWALLGKTVGNNILAAYKRAGTGITKKSIMTGNEIAQLQGEKSQIVNAGELLASKKARHQELSLMEAEGKLDPNSDEYKELHGVKDEKGNMVGGLEEDIKRLETTATMNPKEREAAIAKKNEEIKALQDRQKTETGGPIGAVFGFFARSQAAQRKHLRKSQGQAETLDKILSKRVGAEAGGWIFNRLGAQVVAQDRYERGILEGEDMRSKSKDDEYIKMGKAATLAGDRQKWTGAGSFQKGIKGFLGMREQGSSMIGEVVKRQRAAAGYEGIMKALTAAQHISIDVSLRNKLAEAQKQAAAGNPHLLNVLLGHEKPTDEEMEQAKAEIEAENADKKEKGIPFKKLKGEELEEAARKRAGYDPLAVALMNEEMAKTAEVQQKEAHGNALKAFAGTDIGKEIYQAFAEAELGAKIGEDFIKSIKSSEIRNKFKEAKKMFEAFKAKQIINPEEFDSKLKAREQDVREWEEEKIRAQATEAGASPEEVDRIVESRRGDIEAEVQKLSPSLVADLKGHYFRGDEGYEHELDTLSEKNKYISAIRWSEEAETAEHEAKGYRSDAKRGWEEAEDVEQARYNRVQKLKEQEEKGEQLSAEDQIFLDENRGMHKPHMTQAMRKAWAKSLETGATEYSKTVGHEQEELAAAAERIDQLKTAISASGDDPEARAKAVRELMDFVSSNAYAGAEFYKMLAKADKGEIERGEADVVSAIEATAPGAKIVSRIAGAEYGKKVSDETSKGRLLEQKRKIVKDETPGSVAARLKKQLAENEALNEAVQGFEQGGMYDQAQQLFHAATEKITAALEGDAEMSDIVAEKDKASTELGQLKSVLEQNKQKVAEIARGLGGEWGDLFKSYFESARSAAAGVQRNDGESDVDYSYRKQKVALESLKSSVGSSGLTIEEQRLFMDDLEEKDADTLLLDRVDTEVKQESTSTRRKEIMGKEVGRRREVITKLSDQGEITGWEAARAQAEREHNSTFYRSARKFTMNKAAQAYIWDLHGVKIPNDGETEAIETMGKNFSDMNYETTVKAFETQHAKLRDKIARGEEITFEEKVIAMANFNRLMKDSWVDDITMPTQERLLQERLRFSEMVKELEGGGTGFGSERSVQELLARLETRKNKPVVSEASAGTLSERRMDQLGDIFVRLYNGSAEQAKTGIGAIIQKVESGADPTEDLRRLRAVVRSNLKGIDNRMLTEALGLEREAMEGETGLSNVVNRINQLLQATRDNFYKQRILANIR